MTRAGQRDEMPSSRAIRVVGRLDTIAGAKEKVRLVLADGSGVLARLGADAIEAIQALFDSKVVVSGVGHFGASGRLLTIDVEHIGPARSEDALFERTPRAKLGPVPTSVQQPAGAGVSAFFDTWPGEEGERELLAALEAMR